VVGKIACKKASCSKGVVEPKLIHVPWYSKVTDYLHDFYMYSFVVAKYWGRGPSMHQWTAGLVSSLTTGSLAGASPPNRALAMLPGATPDRWDEIVNQPTQLCKWSIHVKPVAYSPIPEKDDDVPDEFDIDNPQSWRMWSEKEMSVSFTSTMQQSLMNNTFSFTSMDSLPIAPELISASVQKDPDLLLGDAVKAAIMAGNSELLDNLLEDAESKQLDMLKEIHPFHLAAAILDGGHRCCSVIETLSGWIGPEYLFFNQHDDLGHTVLDALLVTVLRSHTTVSPEHVNPCFNPPHRYPGEEKDVCGRWDADSPAVRSLFRCGFPRIPTSWKHAFCHTAVQAVCHSAIIMLGSPARPPIDAPSGLFLRRCNNCGLELKLGPLHTVIVVAFYLAHCGMPGETLLGILAVLVCLLSLGANPSMKTDMSVQEILGGAEMGRRYHKLMDSYDLMQEVPERLISGWTPECQVGWSCIRRVLLLAKRDSDAKLSRAEVESMSENDCQDDSDGTSDSDLEESAQGHWGSHGYCVINDGDEGPCAICGQEGGSIEENETEGDQRDRGAAFLSQNDDFDAHSDSASARCRLFSEGLHGEWLNLPCLNPKLGLIWAAIQAELLTYRRVSLEGRWVSGNFSMDALEKWLSGKAFKFQTPLVELRMMATHSPCGWFMNGHGEYLCPVAEEVCSDYFMNMDVYDRASFLPKPELENLWQCVGPPDQNSEE
jgi:hypothetical protein